MEATSAWGLARRAGVHLHTAAALGPPPLKPVVRCQCVHSHTQLAKGACVAFVPALSLSLYHYHTLSVALALRHTPVRRHADEEGAPTTRRPSHIPGCLGWGWGAATRFVLRLHYAGFSSTRHLPLPLPLHLPFPTWASPPPPPRPA